MTVVNIEKRKIFKRRRDGQVAQGGSVSVSVSSSASSSEGEFNPAILQDYAKKVDVHVPSQKALLDALSVEAGYIKYQAAAISIDNADKLGGVVAASYARKDTVNTYEYDQTINADLYVNGDIIHRGSAYKADFERVEVQNNLMQLNVGEPGSQITGVIPGTAIAFSGIEINRGTGEAYYMGVVEGAKPLLKLGKKDSLEAIATRADSIADGHAIQWDNTNKMMIGVSAVRDSLKLGGINASEFWHKGNSNLSGVDWTARKLELYGGVDAIRAYNEGWINLYNANNTGRIRLNYATATNRLDIYDQTADRPADVRFRNFETTADGTKTTGNNEVTGSSTLRGDVVLQKSSGYNKLFLKNSTGSDYIQFDYNSIYTPKPFYITGPGGSQIIWDTANVKVKSDLLAYGNIGSPSYASGFLGTGWRIEASGAATMDSLELRKFLRTPELIKNQVQVEKNEFWFTDSEVIESVEVRPAGSGFSVIYRLRFSLKDGDTQSFRIGDILRGIFNHTTGFETGFYRVVGVEETLIDVGIVSGQIPRAFMRLARQGSLSDTARQGSMYADGLNGYLRVLGDVNSETISLSNIRLQLGDLSTITDSAFGDALSGYGLYADNAYLKGAIVASSGKIGGWTIAYDRIHSGNTFASGGAGIEISSNTASKRLIAFRNTTNFVNHYYTNSSDWGIQGVKDNATVFQLGSSNQIAGWNFTSNTLSSPTVSNGKLELATDGDVPRVQVYRDNDNLVRMYQSTSSWGLIGNSGGTTVFQLGSTNKIAGWNFSVSELTKDNIHITTGSSGIFCYDGTSTKWILRQNGSGTLAGGAISWTSTGVTTFSNALKAHIVNATTVNAVDINASSITSGTLSASRFSAGSITADKLASDVLTAQYINFDNATGSNVNLSGTINADDGNIGGFNIYSTKLTSITNNLHIDTQSGVYLLSGIGQGGLIGFGQKTDDNGSFYSTSFIRSYYSGSTNKGIEISSNDGYNVKVNAGDEFIVDADAFNVNCAASFNNTLSVSGKVTVNNNIELQGAVNVKTRIITYTTTLTNTDYYATVSMSSSSSRTVYLPNSPTAGRVIKVKRRGGSQHPIINGNGKSIYWMDATPVSSITIDWRHGAALEFIYDGVYWCVICENY